MTAIAEKLRQPPYALPTIVLSIDDLYLTHEQQAELAAAFPDNPLIQHRGQPSTHDLTLALSLLADLRGAKECRLPSYDKSMHSGQGDRSPQHTWQLVNKVGQPTCRLVILEGWCVGFRALSAEELTQRWQDAARQKRSGGYDGRLGFHKLEDVAFINEALRRYDSITDHLDALIHVDASDPKFVYQWREEQERVLRESKGSGMTSEQIRAFVDGYYPAYELFTDGLRAGIFEGGKERQLRLVINRDRKVQERVEI